MQCVGGLCVARVGPTSIARCVVQPANAVTHEGNDKTFRLLSFTINIFLARPIEAKSSKLNSSPLHLSISWHTNGLLLLKNASLVAGSSVR